MRARKTLIYCVGCSSEQDAQEARCRDLTANIGCTITRVFSETVGPECPFIVRPGAKELLRYLAAHQNARHLILIDDPKRVFAAPKDLQRFRTMLRGYDTRLECVSYSFEDTSEGAFITAMLDLEAQVLGTTNERGAI